jgi:hypothetical protein
MRFSQRRGFTPVASVIQKDYMSDALRNLLWNALHILVWQSDRFMWNISGPARMNEFSAALWFEYLKLPLDERPRTTDDILRTIRSYFFEASWHQAYDFLEWVLNYESDDELTRMVNSILEQELSGYRFVHDTFTDITSADEIDLLQSALSDDRFAGVQLHLATALRHLSSRESPDYRNSIKESISAVESMCQVVTGRSAATLGEALSSLEKQRRLHPALKGGFSKLYGYTSDEGGIRHAMLEEPALTAADAKFFLLSCTSFINYLKSFL